MATWHETMMLSSDSFRECHENGKYGNGEETPKDIELVNDYISITNQGGGHYWSTPAYDNGFEVGKEYKIILNDEEFTGSTVADGNVVKLNTSDEKLDMKYNTASGMYVINYYPTEDIGSNPTVNFEVWEVTGEEKPAIFVVKFTGDSCDKTYAEIKSALTTGVPVIGIDVGKNCATIPNVRLNDGENLIYFIGNYCNNKDYDSINYMMWTIDENNTIEFND